MISEALSASGGVSYLTWAAKNEPRGFLALVGRTIPSEVKATLEGVTTVRVVTGFDPDG